MQTEGKEQYEDEGSVGEPGLASDPMAELPVKSSKYVKACTELYLGHKDLRRVEGFEPFVHLHTLWLNGNRLEQITNLDRNFRIKHLYIQDNLLRSLTGSIERFTFLQVLHCFNNKLSDFSGTLNVLSRLAHLKVLDLFGNPIAEEPGFRAKTIHRLTDSLQFLDRLFITPQEREDARFRCNSGTPHDAELSVAMKRSPEDLAGGWSSCTQMLFQQVEEAAKQRQFQALSLGSVSRTEGNDDDHDWRQGERRMPLGKYLDFKSNADRLHGLSVWEKFRLAHMLDELGGKEMTEKQLYELLAAFADYSGKVVEREEVDRLLVRLNAEDEDKGIRDMPSIMCALTLPDVPWRPLGKSDLAARSKTLFEEANACYKEMQLAGNNSPEGSGGAERRRLHRRLVCATRLQCMAKETPMRRGQEERTVHLRKDFYFDRPFRTKAISNAGEAIASMTIEDDGRAECDLERWSLARKFGLERAIKKKRKPALTSPFSKGPLYV